MHSLLIGIFLGWGAAIPIGPMNIEIIRRNLWIGTSYGVAFGFGACSADLSYFILLSAGALTFLTNPIAIKLIGVLGSLILVWFGIMALRLKVSDSFKIQKANYQSSRPNWTHALHGYFMTLINPSTILFWSSVSAQIALLAHQKSNSANFAALGVIIGTISWMVVLNIVLNFYRQKLTSRAMLWLNKSGGFLLLAFAAIGFYHVI